jgi:uncharacterized protein YndB with AHSA1/START domain
MSTVAVTQVVDAPLERVWRLATDLAARARWLAGVAEVEVLSPGPFGAGTTWRETRSLPGGTRVTEEFRVTSAEPQRCFVIASPGIGADYRMTYTFAAVRVGRRRGGTSVTVEQEGTPSGATGRVLGLVLGGLAARTAEGAIRRELADLATAALDPDPATDDGDSASAA